MGFGSVRTPGLRRGDSDRLDADWNVVTPDYFATMGLRLVRGRDFSATDTATAPLVAIVNEAMAKAIWGTVDVVGRTFEVEDGPDDAWKPIAVVGVAGDAHLMSLDDRSEPYLYVPLSQRYRPRVSLVVKSAGGTVIPGMRALIREMNPNLPVSQAMPLTDVTALGLIPQRIAAGVAGSLGILGLLLAGIGIYGVTSYSVNRRVREIGIRVALGADVRSVRALIVRQGLVLTLVGVAIGLVAGAVVSRLMRALLFGVSALIPSRSRPAPSCSSPSRSRRATAPRTAPPESTRSLRSARNRESRPHARNRLAGHPLRAPAAAPQPALHRHGRAVARGRHRRQHDDLFGRERHGPAAAARARRTPHTARHRPDAGRRRFRHRLVCELRGHPAASDDGVGRVCLPHRAAADQPRRRARGRAHLRGAGQRQLLRRARHDRGARPAAERRRRSTRRPSGCRDQLRALGAALRRRRQRRWSRRRFQRLPGDHRRGRAARLPGDDGDAGRCVAPARDGHGGGAETARVALHLPRVRVADDGRAPPAERERRAGERRVDVNRRGPSTGVSRRRSRHGPAGVHLVGLSRRNGRRLGLPRRAPRNRRAGPAGRLRQSGRDAARARGFAGARDRRTGSRSGRGGAASFGSSSRRPSSSSSPRGRSVCF